MTYFGDTLRVLRERAGLDQRAASARVGFTAGHLYRLESGVRPAPQPNVLRQLAERLGVSRGALVAAALLDRWTPEDLAAAFAADPHLRRVMRRALETS